jgi:hypothetical protein
MKGKTTHTVTNTSRMFSGLVSLSSTFPAIVSFPINMGRYSDLGERLVILSKSQGSSLLLPFPFVREYR